MSPEIRISTAFRGEGRTCCCDIPGPGNAQPCSDAEATFPDGKSIPGGEPCHCVCHEVRHA